MATRIRLRRIGRKKLPLYRIVVAEKTAAATPVRPARAATRTTGATPLP